MSAVGQLRPGNLKNRCRVSHREPWLERASRASDCYRRRVLKLLLMSPLLATFLIPAAAASGKKPVGSLRAMLLWVLVADLAYALFLHFIYLRFA
jgi:hypothetical protein